MSGPLLSISLIYFSEVIVFLLASEEKMRKRMDNEMNAPRPPPMMTYTAADSTIYCIQVHLDNLHSRSIYTTHIGRRLLTRSADNYVRTASHYSLSHHQ